MESSIFAPDHEVGVEAALQTFADLLSHVIVQVLGVDPKKDVIHPEPEAEV